MKKLFTLIFALVGFTGIANAETVDDLAVLKHSYVLVCDEFTNNGTEKIAKNAIYGDGFFFTPTGHDKATNKKSVNLADSIWGADINEKYGEYGTHLNSMRIKNAQDVFAMKVTAKSKVIIFFNGQGKEGTAARLPKLATNAALTEGVQNPAPVEGDKYDVAKFEWTAPDDMTIYIGSYNGDTYISYVIVEANEAPGTPSVKVGDTKYEDGLYFKEVICKPMPCTEEGSTEKIPTIVTYTTDGSTPTAESDIYVDPIKCYENMTVKFQAYMDFGDGEPVEDFKCEGADNEGIVTFSFDAPTMEVDGGHVTISTPYENATNYYSYGDVVDQAGNEVTLSESATVSAYSKIVNGGYATFTTKSVTKDVYVLNPIKEQKVVELVNAVIKDSIDATTAEKVYYVESADLTADKMDFFVKDLVMGAIAGDNAKYQAPEGKEAYIQMSNTNITFKVAEGDSLLVTVTCSKNSCKVLEGDSPDHKCYVNLGGGLTFGTEDITLEGANIIKFGLGAGTYTFQKYSGTGNIFISSIVMEPYVAPAPGTVEAYMPTDETGVAKAEWVAESNEAGNVVDIDATPSVHLYALSGPESGWTDGETLPLAPVYNNGWAVKNNRNNVWDDALQATKTLYFVNGAGNPTTGVAFAMKYTDDQPTGTYRTCYNKQNDPNGPWYAEDGVTELTEDFDFYYHPDGTTAMPKYGAYYQVTPRLDGTMKFLVWNNKGSRPVYVVDNDTYVALNPLAGEVKYSGYVNGKDEFIDPADESKGKKMTFFENLVPQEGKEYIPQAEINAGQAAWVYLTFPVKANKTYWLFNGNTQLGFGGFEFTVGGEPVGKKGDANGDTEINVNDITTIAAYILNGTAEPFVFDNADANSDGQINVNDITATAAIILGTN